MFIFMATLASWQEDGFGTVKLTKQANYKTIQKKYLEGGGLFKKVLSLNQNDYQ